MSGMTSALIAMTLGIAEILFFNKYGAKFATELGIPLMALQGLLFLRMFVSEWARMRVEHIEPIGE